MDERRFDQIARLFAAGSNRRHLLRGLLGLGGAAVVGTVVAGDADAASRSVNPSPTPVRCPGNQIVVGGLCTCPAGFDNCGPDCCAPGAQCCDGACCNGACYGEELCCPISGTVCGANCCDNATQLCCEGVCV